MYLGVKSRAHFPVYACLPKVPRREEVGHIYAFETTQKRHSPKRARDPHAWSSFGDCQTPSPLRVGGPGLADLVFVVSGSIHVYTDIDAGDTGAAGAVSRGAPAEKSAHLNRRQKYAAAPSLGAVLLAAWLWQPTCFSFSRAPPPLAVHTPWAPRVCYPPRLTVSHRCLMLRLLASC